MENFDITCSMPLLSGLETAFEDSLNSNTCIPLLKQELKSKIQIRRLQQGQAELKVTFEPKPKYEMTDEEKQKQARRREVNRIAALKFRRKKKDKITQLEEKANQLTAENKRLEEELKQWRNLHQTRQDSSPATSESGFVWVVIQADT
ncbi:cyclic AMP-dependent transcription factor ATF-3-like [Haliotis asinina]|uniref:cyclic AMP-dependent transcription factor ATF-3-like n=1 Tax=Haliotis asinina TaxID=109174 RepID=UPI003532619A